MRGNFRELSRHKWPQRQVGFADVLRCVKRGPDRIVAGAQNQELKCGAGRRDSEWLISVEEWS